MIKMAMEKGAIGIIGAMDIEISAILEAAEIYETEEHGGVSFYQGSLSGVPCVVARCGVGKVNSALCVQSMIDFFQPRLILNIGVAGGLGPDVHIGDVVIATACVQHDFDVTPFGASLGEIDVPSGEGCTSTVRFPCDKALSEKLAAGAKGLYSGTVHSGVVATGDRFVADPELGNWLYKTFDALACEMEGGSIAHACMANGIPCVVLRSISDNANDSDTMDYQTFARDSAMKVQKLLAGVIGEL